MGMRTCILFNGRAGTAAKAAALREALGSRRDVALHEPATAEEATALAAQAVREGYDMVVAAGGDGTINAVLNGLANDFRRTRLAILPLGTGNDLCRTLAIPDDPLEALALCEQGSERRLDIFRVEAEGKVTHGLNVAAGGFSGQLEERLTDEMKQTWGPLAYLRGAASVLPDLKKYETYLGVDGAPAERIDAFNIVVANGRTAGRGFLVAPTANPEDGLLDVIVVQDTTLLDLAAVAAQLFAGNYLDHDQVTHRLARRVEVSARPGLWFSVDGDLFSNAPTTFTVLPRALRVVVGPGYAPNAPAPAAAST